jgi:hypothetical protein
VLNLDMSGPLAGAFPLLSLRTNKADVVTGIEKETAVRLDASGEKWRVDGRCVDSLMLFITADFRPDYVAMLLYLLSTLRLHRAVFICRLLSLMRIESSK